MTRKLVKARYDYECERCGRFIPAKTQYYRKTERVGCGNAGYWETEIICRHCIESSAYKTVVRVRDIFETIYHNISFMIVKEKWDGLPQAEQERIDREWKEYDNITHYGVSGWQRTSTSYLYENGGHNG